MEADLALLAVVLLVAGFLSGIVAGLLGVGGGMILVPVLFQTFIFFDLPAHLQIHMAVASSMAIICFTGTLSARSHFRRGAVDVDVVKSWGMFIAIGALAGAVAARYIAPAGLKIIFATLALSMATRMLLNKNPGEAGAASIGLVMQKGLASLVGFFSGADGYWRRHIICAIAQRLRARRVARGRHIFSIWCFHCRAGGFGFHGGRLVAA
jgi:uncharacterized membrane protein YfcA